MIDISVLGIEKYYGGNHVIKGVSFNIQEGEHVGLLGANGAGKTTLFRLLSGEETPDAGEIVIPDSRRIGLLSQIPVVKSGVTAEDVLRQAFAPLWVIQAEMDDILSGGHDEKQLLRYGELEHKFEAMGGFESEVKLAKVRQGLDISDKMYKMPFESLSGGEKTRAHLARLILEETDILLLDEPTNHLDMRSTEWLEEYLSKYKGTVLCISHDRYFLDEVVDRIIELEDGFAQFYSGNYSFFAEEKRKRRQEQQDRYVQEQRKINQLEATARRMHDYAGGNAKLHRRAFAIEKRAARIKTTDRPRRVQELKALFKETSFLADDVARIDGISKRFGQRSLFENVVCAIRPGDRIALLGNNGAGKTTLMRILVGEWQPDTGRIRYGPAVKTAYLPQVIEWSHPERTLLDTMLFEENCTPQEARDRLGMFNFRGEDVFKTVGNLSGGERSRLKFCIMMGEKINFLCLDEPTNHLDITSREWMEEAVESFNETMLFISHDRYFISRFATRIWSLENGKLTDFSGDYEEFREYEKLREAEIEPVSEKIPETPRQTVNQKRERQRDAQRRLIEQEMVKLEKEEAEIDALAEQNTSDAERLLELLQRKDQIQEKWQRAFERWQDM